MNQSTRTCSACMPFWPLAATKETVWPSFRLLKPSLSIALKCTNRSSPPPCGVIKPKPFSSLNHFTVPVWRLDMVYLQKHNFQ
ncbi:5,10-methylenetetrahydrofolate reductase [Pseudomonas syringae pv. actinidiae]|uniref:5,10-methylenetetrahydrofolate reductase n=1 Tax=Pseudomonas syringae pv. actinidiae TaxID=103796 RepID=A0AAN4TM90_PSESF|nr:5,10-methylenetetrahydrofolate reductase [Pseudomonas syringae pv. actinidiae]